MKTILSAIVALSVLTGVAASVATPASAFDYQQFWRDHGSGGQGT
jgi:hypothetical protein